MWETKTSDGPASEAILAPTFTAMPPTFPAINSTSPVCTPAHFDPEVLHGAADRLRAAHPARSQVILPLSGPALATLGVFTFIGVWNDS